MVFLLTLGCVCIAHTIAQERTKPFLSFFPNAKIFKVPAIFEKIGIPADCVLFPLFFFFFFQLEVFSDVFA